MNSYSTAAAFKQALESRIRSSSVNGTDFARRRQLLVFNRLLARITRELGDAVVLKGGLVVELRVERARTTKDVDLRITGSQAGLESRLRHAAARELGDFMIFTIALDAEHPQITNEGLMYQGQRFRVDCALAGKPYGQPFGLDVAFAEPIFGKPDVVTTEDVLGFAGIEPPSLRLYPLETHIAEKLHAYTLPRNRPNSRVKDLPDIALLAGVRTIKAESLRSALKLTFDSRKTHPLPGSVPPPAEAWVAPYARMVQEDELAWSTLSILTKAVEEFLNPVLHHDASEVWSPSTWKWTSTRSL